MIERETLRRVDEDGNLLSLREVMGAHVGLALVELGSTMRVARALHLCHATVKVLLREQGVDMDFRKKENL